MPVKPSISRVVLRCSCDGLISFAPKGRVYIGKVVLQVGKGECESCGTVYKVEVRKVEK